MLLAIDTIIICSHRSIYTLSVQIINLLFLIVLGIYIFALCSINTIANCGGDSLININIALVQIQPPALDTLGRKYPVYYVRYRLSGNICSDSFSFTQLDLAHGVLCQCTRTQVDAHQRPARLGDLVQDLVGWELGLVVRRQGPVIDLFVVFFPVAGGPPGSGLAAGAGVGDEEEAADGGLGGGGVDEVDGGVAVDAECAFGAVFTASACV